MKNITVQDLLGTVAAVDMYIDEVLDIELPAECEVAREYISDFLGAMYSACSKHMETPLEEFIQISYREGYALTDVLIQYVDNPDALADRMIAYIKDFEIPYSVFDEIGQDLQMMVHPEVD